MGTLPFISSSYVKNLVFSFVSDNYYSSPPSWVRRFRFTETFYNQDRCSGMTELVQRTFNLVNSPMIVYNSFPLEWKSFVI